MSDRSNLEGEPLSVIMAVAMTGTSELSKVVYFGFSHSLHAANMLPIGFDVTTNEELSMNFRKFWPGRMYFKIPRCLQI